MKSNWAINDLFKLFFNKDNYQHPLILKILNEKSKNMAVQSGSIPLTRVSKVFDLETRNSIFTKDQIKAIDTICLPDAYWDSSGRVYKLQAPEAVFPKGRIILLFSSQKKELKEEINVLILLDKYAKIISDQTSRKNGSSEDSYDQLVFFKLFQLLEEMNLYLTSPEVDNYIKTQLFNQFLGLTKERDLENT